MNNIQEQFCEAVDIIVSQKLANAGFNKSIEGTIISCEDTITGKYKVRFQDSILDAYAANPNIVYSVDSLVYIIIPSGDMRKDKIIISSKEKKISNYAPTLDEDNKYEIIGANAISQLKQIELCSYSPGNLEIYRYNSNNDFLTTNNETLKETLSVGGYLKIKLNVKTNLNLEQQSQGDYGIRFELIFNDSKGAEQSKFYEFSTSNILGNPYTLINKQEQVVYYKVENPSNFVRVETATAFINNFPNEKEDRPVDIFLSDLELYGVKQLTEENLSGVYVSLLTPQGYIFTSSSSDDEIKNIIADVKINGLSTNRTINYYWFKENVLIQSINDNGYSHFAGIGWEAIDNNKNILSLTKKDITARQVQYKCIIKFADEDNITYEQNKIIENTASSYYFNIRSESGNKFFYGNGSTILACKAFNNKGESISLTNDYHYIWKRVENDGDIYFYDSDNFQFDNNIKAKNKNREYEIVINPAAIVNKNYYYCYVFDENNIYLGYGETYLVNSTEATSSDYHIEIYNSQQTFTYDKNGYSPIHISKAIKQNIPELTFILYDNENQVINANKILNEGGKIQWKIPYENTMLIANMEIEPSSSDTTYKYDIYEDIGIFYYTLSDLYDYSFTNNNILLEVTYQNIVIRAKTNFTFTKDNDIGTNGTDSTVVLMPNYGGNVLTQYYYGDSSYKNFYFKEKESDIYCNKYIENFTVFDTSSKELFTPKLIKGVNEIPLNNSNIKWQVLRDISTKKSIINDTENDGIYSVQVRSNEWAAADNHNILQAIINYNNYKYYAEAPIVTVNMYNPAYQIALKPYTGFQFIKYDMNGYNPSYNSTYPFEIMIGVGSPGNSYTTLNDLSDYTFYWEVIGDIQALIDLTGNYNTNNIHYIVPFDYFQGDCTNLAIYVEVYKGKSNKIGDIHIPIYAYLDRFSQNIKNWNGNYVLNNNETIISPIGYLDENITGTFLGKVKNSNSEIKSGLFNYINGQKAVEISSDEVSINYQNNNFELDKNGIIQKLTLGDSVLINGNNIDENIVNGNKGLGKVLSNYVTNENLNDILSGYTTDETFTKLDSAIAKQLGFEDESCINAGETISPEIVGGNITMRTADNETYFNVTNEGLLTAKGAVIDAELSGTIGGFSIVEEGFESDYAVIAHSENGLDFSIPLEDTAITFLNNENNSAKMNIYMPIFWHNPEDELDTLNLIEEIKLLKEEVKLLKEELEALKGK